MTTPTLIFTPGILAPTVHPTDDGISPVTTTGATGWNTFQNVSSQGSTAWRIIAQGITSQQASGWNDLVRIKAHPGFSVQGIGHPVVVPVDEANHLPAAQWDVDQRRSSTDKTTWKVFQRKPSQKKTAWVVRVRTTAQHATAWRIRQQIQKTSTSVENRTGLDEPVVHAISAQKTSQVPLTTWNVAQRLSRFQGSRWNTTVSARSTGASTWNTVDTHVAKQRASTWNTQQSVTVQATSTWNTIQRRPAFKATSWMTNAGLTKQASSAWNTFKLVVKQQGSSWATISRRGKQQGTKWHTRSAIISRRATAWRDLHSVVSRNWKLVSANSGNVAASVVRPIDYKTPSALPYPFKNLDNPVVNAISYVSNPGYGDIALPGSTWNVGVTLVTKQLESTWNVYTDGHRNQRSTWNTSGRSASVSGTRYNVRIRVSSQASTAWNVGPGLETQIRQTSFDHIDFAY